MTHPFVISDHKKFRTLWLDRRITIGRIARIFGCSKSAVHDTAKRLELPGKRSPYNGSCENCRFGALDWCRAHPYAEQLPCEVEPTPHTDHWREISVYHSPNGFWQEGDGRR